MLLIGIDLAWGEHKSDGLCFLRYRRGTKEAWVDGYAYPQGDDAAFETIAEIMPQAGPTLLLIDAPIVCPNLSGCRPVDRLISRLFYREHAGCHSANLAKCSRPARLLARLVSLGFSAGWDLSAGRLGGREPLRLATEVYPHPAMVRLLCLPRIVKYKKGRVAQRSVEFKRLQDLLGVLLAREFPFLSLDDATRVLLTATWSKPVEDQLDAFFCALIGLWLAYALQGSSQRNLGRSRDRIHPLAPRPLSRRRPPRFLT